MLEEQERKREGGPTLHALCLEWPFLSDWSCPGRDGGPVSVYPQKLLVWVPVLGT